MKSILFFKRFKFGFLIYTLRNVFISKLVTNMTFFFLLIGTLFLITVWSVVGVISTRIPLISLSCFMHWFAPTKFEKLSFSLMGLLSPWNTADLKSHFCCPKYLIYQWCVCVYWPTLNLYYFRSTNANLLDALPTIQRSVKPPQCQSIWIYCAQIHPRKPIN